MTSNAFPNVCCPCSSHLFDDLDMNDPMCGAAGQQAEPRTFQHLHFCTTRNHQQDNNTATAATTCNKTTASELKKNHRARAEEGTDVKDLEDMDGDDEDAGPGGRSIWGLEGTEKAKVPNYYSSCRTTSNRN